MVKRFIFGLTALLLIAIPAMAQTTATLSGTVTSDGKALPGVTVTISSPQMQGTRTTVSGEAGGYQFQAIPPGAYAVKFELEGLKTVTKTTQVGLSQTGRVDADLKVAAVAEAITVTASAPAVLETSSVTANVPQKLLNDLPAGRTITAAVSLAPGVTPGVGGFAISGAPSFENLYLVNGVTVSENVRGQPHNLFIEDAVQETTISTAGISAEYGRFAGGVVNTITKSGGNVFSGSFRDTLTNPKWVSLTPIESTSHINKTNQVDEATLGGYILKDRLWFFGAGRKAKVATQATTQFTGIPFVNADDQKRFEGKLTGQINPKHSLVGSYLKIKETELNNNFNGQAADLETLVPTRQLPNDLKSIFYNGILTPNTLLELGWTKKYFAFIGSGSPFSDFIHGTLIRDTGRGVRLASPTFCGVCDTEQRNNKSYLGKLSYFLNTKSMGTHSFSGGVENFDQMRFANNHQSGSDYRLLTGNSSKIVGSNIYPVFNASSELVWTAIFNNASFGHFKTQSGFVNDKWDMNSHYTFNLGLRYDKNNAVDGNGNKISDDSAFSPRLGLTYDLKGNGRSKFNASFGRYVAALAENAGESFASAGQPAYIEFAYTGPAINTGADLVDKFAAIGIIQNWFFNTIGGPTAALHDPNVLIASSVPGLSTVLTQKLVSPHTDEFTFGYGQQIGAAAYARADYVHRSYKDYYGSVLDLATGTYADPFTGARGDVATVVNDPDIKRTYHAIQFQSQYQRSRYTAGATYTFASTKGNTETETGGSGPVAVSVNNLYPEFLNYPNRVPSGRLAQDIRHRARGWLAYDVPTPSFIGRLNLSVLHEYESGRPYSAAGTIDPTGRNANFRFAGAPCTGAQISTCNTLGYTLSQLGTSQTYFFSGRGALQTAALHSTDLSANWDLPITKVALFVKGEALNVFNRHAVLAPNTTVVTRRSGGSGTGLLPFNPFTATPIECPQGTAAATCTTMGANWQKGPSFGQASSSASFQAARTYRLGLGLRF